MNDKYEVFFQALPEEISVKGNALASDNEKLNKEAEDEILQRLESGDIYAWFTAKVTVRDEDGNEASDYLGCCSYENEKDFRAGGYFQDMVDECIRQLEAA